MCQSKSRRLSGRCLSLNKKLFRRRSKQFRIINDRVSVPVAILNDLHLNCLHTLTQFVELDRTCGNLEVGLSNSIADGL